MLLPGLNTLSQPQAHLITGLFFRSQMEAHLLWENLELLYS